MPVSRIMVRQPKSKANAGAFNNGMPMTSSLGCGTWGGNIVSENVHLKHYLNTTWVSVPIKEDRPSDEELFGDFYDAALENAEACDAVSEGDDGRSSTEERVQWWADEHHRHPTRERSPCAGTRSRSSSAGVGFVDTIWLMVRGELPSPAQAALFEAALVASVDHGPQAPSIAIARMAITCGVPVNGAMASAINVLDDIHGGPGQQCMELYLEIEHELGASGDLEVAVRSVLERHRAAGDEVLPRVRPPVPSGRPAHAAAALARRRCGRGRRRRRPLRPDRPRRRRRARPGAVARGSR